jgi:DinB superfamily
MRRGNYIGSSRGLLRSRIGFQDRGTLGYPDKVSAAVDFALPVWSQRLISELAAADGRAQSVAKGLSLEQLNWQPRHGAWSIGQCLDHLQIANRVYVPAISEALDGQQRGKSQELSVAWPSRWFIRNYIAPNPDGARARAPGKIKPAKQVEPTVLQAFLRGNEAARALIARASEYDVNRLRFRNPFVPILRFTVGTGLEIIAKHESRHLLQAERVRQSPEFPG